MLTSREIAENYYSNREHTMAKNPEVEQSTPKAHQSTPALFNLKVRVTGAQVEVDCSFPGGRIAGSGEFETVLPLLKSIWPKVQDLVNKGGE